MMEISAKEKRKGEGEASNVDSVSELFFLGWRLEREEGDVLGGLAAAFLTVFLGFASFLAVVFFAVVFFVVVLVLVVLFVFGLATSSPSSVAFLAGSQRTCDVTNVRDTLGIIAFKFVARDNPTRLRVSGPRRAVRCSMRESITTRECQVELEDEDEQVEVVSERGWLVGVT